MIDSPGDSPEGSSVPNSSQARMGRLPGDAESWCRQCWLVPWHERGLGVDGTAWSRYGRALDVDGAA
ncbi:hypothetical protein IW249_005790 [Micromonospora vinacea]|uniref:Uncharacterized protein n=1 Tax=Micromonospora vinacea TaxID=709878 RepID=A0ABS0KA49_9ACTN|nr:hypothetical protein [Micromonospora vinacea]MBG6105376.1 hypothetical protein [Micromonospora vinacea]